MNKKNNKITMRESDLKNHERQVASRCYQMYTVVSLMAVRDCFGFGNKRLNRILDKMNKILEEIQEKRVTLEDLQNTLKDEVKINAFWE
jgi:gas vesicle protein